MTKNGTKHFPKGTSLSKRLKGRSFLDPETGCWVWDGALSEAGYGVIGIGGKNFYAHRASYERFVEEIPVGLTLDHLCKNPSCINPKHLEPVTLRENVMRGNGRGAVNARKTKCKRGHRFSGENLLIINATGERRCRTCALVRNRKYAKEFWKAKGKSEKTQAYLNSQKTHCPEGHPLLGDNLYVYPGGNRSCRTCRRAQDKQQKLRAKARKK